MRKLYMPLNILNGIHEAGESTLSEIVSLYIVFSHLLTICIVYNSTRG